MKSKMILIKVIMVSFSITWVHCSIAGLNYMDPIEKKPQKTYARGEDPCNPLYWYPRNIPDFCYKNTTGKLLPPVPRPKPIPLPMPIRPFPIAPMLPMPPLPYPAPPYFMPPPPLPMPMYPPAPMPLPFGVPIEPAFPMLPVAVLYPPYRPPPLVGMVPGIPGMVTQDGGINILPFSDAYADLLERHKQKMIRRKLEKIFADYGDCYGSKSRSRKHKRNKDYDEY